MDASVCNLVSKSLQDLVKTMPKATMRAINDLAFITKIDSEKGSSVYVDFTKPMVFDKTMTWDYFKYRSMELYDEFRSVEKWYES
jgi:hypothetical protein